MTGIKIGDTALRVTGWGWCFPALCFCGHFCHLYSFAYMAREDGQEKFYALLVMMIGTIIGLGFASDLFNLWIGLKRWQFHPICWLPSTATSQHRLKLVLISGTKRSRFGSGTSGHRPGVFPDRTLDFVEIRTILSYGAAIQPILLAAGALFLVGYGVKTALVPMHTWLPDAHSQAPSGISAMLSGVVIEAGLVALIKSIGLISCRKSTGVCTCWDLAASICCSATFWLSGRHR